MTDSKSGESVLGSRVRKLAEEIRALESQSPAGTQGEVEGIQDLITRLLDNLQNVSQEEAEEILLQIEEAVALFSGGRMLAGALALMRAFALYRKAIRD